MSAQGYQRVNPNGTLAPLVANPPPAARLRSPDHAPPPLAMHSRTLRRILALLLVPLIHANTTPQHIIGSYILSPDAATLADTSSCFTNLTFSRFTFDRSTRNSRILTPTDFNIKIHHEAITLDSVRCTTAGEIQALQSNHPTFATDDQGILNAWARAGGTAAPQPWAVDLVAEAVKLSWLVGYDFTELICRNVLEAGVAYLWYKPQWDHVIGDSFRVRGDTRYLFIIFANGPQRACVYEGDNIRGAGGPTSDPTNMDDDTPDDISDPPSESGSTEDADGSSEVGGNGPSEEEGEDASAEEGDGISADEGDGASSGGLFDDAADAAGDAGGGDEGADCFPKGATVEAEGLGEVQMGGLGRGVRVRDGGIGFSDVFFFSHRDERGVHEFVRLETEGGKIVVLSEGHYVYVTGGMKAAGVVEVGERVRVRDGAYERVVKVGRVWREGRYAPHTLSGDLVVGGVVVSSYTTAVHPRLAHHVLLAPVRGLYRLGLGAWAEGWLDEGKDSLRRWMPRGPDFAASAV